MIPEEINIGTAPNNQTGDPLRTAFQKSNLREKYLDENKTESGGYAGTAQDLKNEIDEKENAFTKNTAFNKDFGITAETVARGNHTHTADQVSETATRKYASPTEKNTWNGKLDKTTNIQSLWTGTRIEYDALTPNANTLYFIQ